MLFHSLEFLFLFLPAVLAAWYGLARLRLTGLAVAALVVASLGFYAWWDWRYVPLLGASIGFNFLVGRRLQAAPSRAWLTFGVLANLALLGWFKYVDFFLGTAEALTGGHYGRLGLALPLGLSFITFQKIAYLVDSHRGHVTGYRLRDFMLFVTFFPQLIAGPIVHHAELIPQLKRARIFVFDPRTFAAGLFLLGAGLFKKVVVADSLAPWVAPAFDKAVALPAPDAWAAALAYTFQIYYDFSGYSEMAIGLALLFNLRLPRNFASPYQATSISDFWRRWHMTLSRFLRDYVYIPLGGNRHGEGRRHANLMATMLVGGLWHGAAWTFVFWGFLHGAYLVANHAWRKAGVALPAPVAGALTFVAVVVAWVFFRAPDFATAGRVLSGMAGLSGFAAANVAQPAAGLFAKQQLLVLGAIAAWVFWAPDPLAMRDRLRPGLAWAGLTAALVVVAVLLLDRPSAFIYYQF